MYNAAPRSSLPRANEKFLGGTEKRQVGFGGRKLGPLVPPPESFSDRFPLKNGAIESLSDERIIRSAYDIRSSLPLLSRKNHFLHCGSAALGTV